MHGPLHEYFLYLVSAPPPKKPKRRCEPEKSYLPCSKRVSEAPGSGSMASWLYIFNSKPLGFIQYDISVYCKLAQWRVTDPVAFYTRRTTIIFGISSYVKLVTLYCQAIFWETEGFGERCVKIMQIVSCLELMINLFIFTLS